MSKTSFGIRVPHCGPFASTEAIGESAKLAEELGYDSVWVNDYIVWTKDLHDVHQTSGSVESLKEDQNPDYFDSLETLSYLAGITKRVKLGVAVLIVPYRHPVTVARRVSTIDNLSNGRMILGVGVGAGRQTANTNFDVLEIPIEEKRQITEEYLRVIRALMAEGTASFNGDYVKFEDAVIYPKPVQGIVPMWMGGSAKAALRIAAESCDGWMPTWFTPKDYKRALPILHDFLAARGRDKKEFTVARELYLCIDEDQQKAEDIARKTLENNAKWFTVRGLEDFEDRVNLARSSSFIGNPDSICREIESYLEVGVSHFEFKVIYHKLDQLNHMMELFADKVMSRF